MEGLWGNWPPGFKARIRLLYVETEFRKQYKSVGSLLYGFSRFSQFCEKWFLASSYLFVGIEKKNRFAMDGFSYNFIF